MHVEDRWLRPTGQVDQRGRPLKEKTARYGSGLRYVAVWREAGKPKSQSFETKDAANAHLGRIAKAQLDGTHIAGHRMTLAEFGDQWVTEQIHQRPNTYAQMESRWRLHIRPVLGPLLITEITARHVQSAVMRWQKDLAPATIQVVYGYTSAILKAAVRDRLIVRSPLGEKGAVNLPRNTHERVIPMTTAQILEAATRITPRYRSLILLGAASGLRSGELRGLTVDRLIDLHSMGKPLGLRVDRQLHDTQPTWGPPKTEKSDRTVTVDDKARGLLIYHMQRWPPHKSGLVFTGRENGPLARTSIATAWEAATRGMGLKDRSGLHELRHYHASLLIAAGLSVTAVADRLGHQDTNETLSTYAHLWPSDESRSRDAIAAGLWA